MIFQLRVLYYYLKTRYFLQFSSRPELLRWQERKVVSFVAWLKRHSRFYGRWSSGISPKDWRHIPLIDKKIMMENLTDLNTVGVDRDQAMSLALKSEENRDFSPTLNGVAVGLSSGTSGNRGLFLVSEPERARYAGTILAKVLPNSIFSENRVAFFMRANNQLYTASKSRRLRFEFFDLLRPFSEQIPHLQNFNPTLIFAPPTALLKIAEAVSEGSLSISPLRIYSVAETLDPLDQERMEKIFGTRIFQVYQCTEGFLGVSCSQGTLHLNEEFVSIEPEWIDSEKKKFIPVITDFTRRTQPILRYRLNDILTVRKTPCPCGSPRLALESIEGRSDDMVFFKAKDKEAWVSVFPDFVRRSIIRSWEGILEYLAYQRKPGELEIYLRTDTMPVQGLERAIRREFEVLCEEIQAEVPKISFLESPLVEGPGLKKLRRVRRLCDEP